MNKSIRPIRHLIAALSLAFAASSGAHAAITLIGKGTIPGNAVDQSGLTGLLEDSVTPRNRIGGFGSAIAYTGSGDLYVAVPDRGPADGTTTYADRLYLLDIRIKPQGVGYSVEPKVIATQLLRNREGQQYTGSAAAFDATNSPGSLRLDPEGIRVDRCGESVYISDEYGPYLYEFSLRSGKRMRSLDVPNKFLIDLPSATASEELSKNAFGRQSNRGMEGLAISPDGAKLYGIMQSALIQDGALDAGNNRIGLNNRILEIDVETGTAREFLYTLESKSNGISEIVAVNDHQFLVLERDGKAGADAKVKKLFQIDIAAASDIRGVKQLPTSGVPGGVVAVTKSLFLDLLNPAFGIVGASAPEKFEVWRSAPIFPTAGTCCW